MTVKVIEIGPSQEQDRADSGGARDGERSALDSGAQGRGANGRRKLVALRRYLVFSAKHVDGMPPLERAADLDHEPISRAEVVIEALLPGRFLAAMVDRVLGIKPVTMHKDARKRRRDAALL